MRAGHARAKCVAEGGKVWVILFDINKYWWLTYEGMGGMRTGPSIQAECTVEVDEARVVLFKYQQIWNGLKYEETWSDIYMWIILYKKYEVIG